MPGYTCERITSPCELRTGRVSDADVPGAQPFSRDLKPLVLVNILTYTVTP